MTPLTADADASRPFYEIRRYCAHPGRRDELVQLMDDLILPFMTENGIQVTASFIDADDPNTYIWIRRFDNESDRIARYEAVYEHPDWTTVLGPKVLILMDAAAAVVNRVVATSSSPLT